MTSWQKPLTDNVQNFAQIIYTSLSDGKAIKFHTQSRINKANEGRM